MTTITPGNWKATPAGVTTDAPIAANVICEAPADHLASYDSWKVNSRFIASAPQMLDALKFAYRKHHLDDESIGWDELSDVLLDALCEAIGDRAFQAWIDEVSP